MSFIYKEPGKVLLDVIKTFMGLTEEQIMFTNQKYFIPNEGIYVAVSYLGPSKVLASISEIVPDGSGGYKERSGVTMLHLIQIEIMGYGNEARTRKEEIAMALRSIYSQQKQELYQMQIARHPGPFMDTSFLEETQMVTRYTTTVMTSSVNRKEVATTEYYDTFPGAEVFKEAPQPLVPILAPPVNPVHA